VSWGGWLSCACWRIVRGNGSDRLTILPDKFNRYTNVSDNNFTDIRLRIKFEKSRLQAYKSHGSICPDCNTQRFTGIAIKTRGNIHRQHRSLGLIDPFDDISRSPPDRSIQPGAEDRINNELNIHLSGILISGNFLQFHLAADRAIESRIRFGFRFREWYQ